MLIYYKFLTDSQFVSDMDGRGRRRQKSCPRLASVEQVAVNVHFKQNDLRI